MLCCCMSVLLFVVLCCCVVLLCCAVVSWRPLRPQSHTPRTPSPPRLPRASELANEIQMLSRYRHPHIVAYLGSALIRQQPGPPDGPPEDGTTRAPLQVHIVMEYVPCGSLAQVCLHPSCTASCRVFVSRAPFEDMTDCPIPVQLPLVTLQLPLVPPSAIGHCPTAIGYRPTAVGCYITARVGVPPAACHLLLLFRLCSSASRSQSTNRQLP